MPLPIERTCPDTCPTGMVVLADELLESFFDEDLQASWRLENLIPAAETTPKLGGAAGWLASLASAVVTDENKVSFLFLALGHSNAHTI